MEISTDVPEVMGRVTRWSEKSRSATMAEERVAFPTGEGGGGGGGVAVELFRSHPPAASGGKLPSLTFPLAVRASGGEEGGGHCVVDWCCIKLEAE